MLVDLPRDEIALLIELVVELGVSRGKLQQSSSDFEIAASSVRVAETDYANSLRDCEPRPTSWRSAAPISFVAAECMRKKGRRPPVCACNTAQSRFHCRCPSRRLADDGRHP